MNKKIIAASALLIFSAGLVSGTTVSSLDAPSEEIVGAAPEITTEANYFETITEIVDGDTFIIAANWSPYPLKWKVRIRGIDTPEKGYRAKCEREKELAAQATALAEQLAHETLGRVKLRNVEHDKYGGRIDADVILADGRSMGGQLIKAGLAKPYNGNGPKPSWCY